MAYGYSGSGKTYTMIEGENDGTDDQKDFSLIRMFLEDNATDTPWNVTFYECYGWAPHALRVEDPTFESRTFVSVFADGSTEGGSTLTMKQAKISEMSGMATKTGILIQGYETFKHLYAKVKEQRSVKNRTAMTPNNAQSSRSHLIIAFEESTSKANAAAEADADADADTEDYAAAEAGQEVKVSGGRGRKVVFVDMAGSEDSVLMGEYMWGLRKPGDDTNPPTLTDVRSRIHLPYLQLEATGMLEKEASTLLENYPNPNGDGTKTTTHWNEPNHPEGGGSLLDDESTVRAGVQRLREGVFINETLNQLKAFFLQNTYDVAKLNTETPDMRSIVATYDPKTQEKLKLPVLPQYVAPFEHFDENGNRLNPNKNIKDKGLDQVTQAGDNPSLSLMDDIPQDYTHTRLMTQLKFGHGYADEVDKTQFLTLLRHVVCGDDEKKCLHSKGKFMLVNTLKDEKSKKQYALQSLQFMDSLNPRSKISKSIMQNKQTFMQALGEEEGEDPDTTPYIRFTQNGQEGADQITNSLDSAVWSWEQVKQMFEDGDGKKKLKGKWTVHRVATTARGLHPTLAYLGTFKKVEDQKIQDQQFYRLEWTTQNTRARVLQSVLMDCLEKSGGDKYAKPLPEVNPVGASRPNVREKAEGYGVTPVTPPPAVEGGGDARRRSGAAARLPARPRDSAAGDPALAARAQRVARLWLDMSGGADPTAAQMAHLARLLRTAA